MPDLQPALSVTAGRRSSRLASRIPLLIAPSAVEWRDAVGGLAGEQDAAADGLGERVEVAGRPADAASSSRSRG